MGQARKSVTPFDNTEHTPGECGMRTVPVLDSEEPQDTRGFIREHTDTWGDRPPLDMDPRLR